MTTDTSERGLERLICTALAGHPCDPPEQGRVAEARRAYGGVGWSGGNPRRKFLARLQEEIGKRGTIDVLRHGIRHGAHDLDLFYGTPSAANEQARERFGAYVED